MQLSRRAPLQLQVDRDRVVRTVLVAGILIATALVFADLVFVYAHEGRVGPFREIFWITAEETIGTWFSASQTLLVGLVMMAIGWLHRQGQTGERAWPWLVLGGIFVYLSADDAAQIHESIGTVVEHSDGGAGWVDWLISSFPTYHWQLVFGLPLLGVVYLLAVFVAPRLQGSRPRRLLIGAIMLLAIAVILDFLEGLAPSHPMNLAVLIARSVDLDPLSRQLFADSGLNVVGHLLRVVEEFLEMVAMTLLLGVSAGHFLGVALPLSVRGPETD